jgi:putative methyltransferase (TIGR04325 family)
MNPTLMHWLRQLVPPILWRRRPTWQGVYARLRDVPTHDGTYGDKLAAEMVETIASAMARLHAGEKPYVWHEHLALAASFVAARQRGVKVLDFGGGPGSGFVQLLSSLPAATAIDYLVVDLQPACDAGRKLFAADGRIRFATEIPEPASAFDIVYVNSTLQYIDDYAATLKRLAALEAPWLLLARLAAGKFPAFATQQVNLPGQILPYWFLGMKEVLEILQSAGYDLACDFLLERVYDQSNLPEAHRAERMRTVLFARRSPASASG